MEATKYYLICDSCGNTTTKKAKGDRGQMFSEAIKDGWTLRLGGGHFCPECNEASGEGSAEAVEQPAQKEEKPTKPEPPQASEKEQPQPVAAPEPQAAPSNDY